MNFIYFYFYILSASPLLGYLILSKFDVNLYNVLGFYSVLLSLFLILLKKQQKFPSYLFIILLLFLYMLIWDLQNGTMQKHGIAKYIFINDPLHTFAFLFIIANTNFSEKFIKRIIRIFLFTAIITFLVSMYQLFVNPDFLSPPRYIFDDPGAIYEYRLMSIFGYIDINELGYSFIPILSILIGYYLHKKAPQYLIFVLIFTGGASAFATNDRWVMLNYIIILTQLIFYYKLSIPRILLGLIIIVLTFYGVLKILELSGYNIQEYVQNRIMSDSAQSRFVAIDMFREFFPQKPLFGTGVHINDEILQAIAGRSSQIHVGYLSHLVSYGLVGSFIRFSLWFALARKLFKEAKFSGFYGSFYAFLSFLAINITLVWYSLFVYGIIFTFAVSKYFKDKAIQENLYESSLKYSNSYA
jgi:hypothetical protein